MHTNQDKEAWDDPKSYGHAFKYTETTAPYNRLAAGQDTEATLGLDKAFRDSAVKEIEEWVVLGSSQDGKFFTGANGINIPDPDTGSGAFKPFVAKNGDGDDLINDLQGLVGETFVQTNFISTAIPQDKEFGWSNNIRVLFRVPPGSKAIYVSGNPKTLTENPYNVQNKYISYFKDSEMEMILPRHQTLKVISVEPTTATGGQYEIDVVVEVVNQPYV